MSPKEAGAKWRGLSAEEPWPKRVGRAPLSLFLVDVSWVGGQLGWLSVPWVGGQAGLGGPSWAWLLWLGLAPLCLGWGAKDGLGSVSWMGGQAGNDCVLDGGPSLSLSLDGGPSWAWLLCPKMGGQIRHYFLGSGMAGMKISDAILERVNPKSIKFGITLIKHVRHESNTFWNSSNPKDIKFGITFTKHGRHGSNK